VDDREEEEVEERGDEQAEEGDERAKHLSSPTLEKRSKIYYIGVYGIEIRVYYMLLWGTRVYYTRTRGTYI
jgi:hypothetical protein